MRIDVQKFRMHQTPADVAYSSMVARMYPQPQPAIFYGQKGVSGLGAFSCPDGWTPCNSDGTPNNPNICLYPGNTCGDAPQPTLGPVCQDFMSWAGQFPNPMGNCEAYYPGSGDDNRCNAYNARAQIVQGQIQQAFADCVPQGATVAFDDASGNWSVSKNGRVLFSGNIGAGNYSYGAAGQAGQNEIQPVNIPQPVNPPVYQPSPELLTPPVYTIQTPTTVTVSPVPSGILTPVSQLPSSPQVSSNVMPASASPAGTPVCSGLSLGGMCLDTTTLLVAGGVLALLLFTRK